MYKVEIKDYSLDINNRKALEDLIAKKIDRTIVPNIKKVLIDYDIYSLKIYIYKDSDVEVVVNPIYVSDFINGKEKLKKAMYETSKILNINKNSVKLDKEKNLKTEGFLEITWNKIFIN